MKLSKRFTVKVFVLCLVLAGACTYAFVALRSNHAETPVKPVGKPILAMERVDAPTKKADPGASVALAPKHLRNAVRTGFIAPRDAAPDVIIAASRDAAAQGDSGAMAALGTALRDCAMADTGGDDAIKDRLARQVVGQERMGEVFNVKVVATDDPTTVLKQRLATRDSCSKISAAEAKTWTDWMERAARAGDQDAAIQYARTALAEFSDPAKRAENLDEYERRKSNAFDFLSDELAEGNCGYEVINELQTMSPDPSTKYVYGSVMLQMSDAAQGRNGTKSLAEIASEELGRQMFEKTLAAQVPPDQISGASNTARYIYQTYCGG